VINQLLYDVVRRLCHEIIEGFKADGVDLNSPDFLSHFSYEFLERCGTDETIPNGQEMRDRREMRDIHDR
jgi:hypothetical protein